MTNEQIAIRQHLSKERPNAAACCCVGAQRNEPVCPCAMQWVEVVDNKWYRIEEHRSTDGITHTVELLGNVGDKLDGNGCPKDKDSMNCKNLKLNRVRAYWLNYMCDKCGYKTSIPRK